jgi:hypothetical protein
MQQKISPLYARPCPFHKEAYSLYPLHRRDTRAGYDTPGKIFTVCFRITEILRKTKIQYHCPVPDTGAD